MAKYTHEQRLMVLEICSDCAEGILPISLAEEKVKAAVPIYPYQNLSGEVSRFKNYMAGRGAYGYGYPATWAKALIELSKTSPKVIQALKTQQQLYYERDGKNNANMAKLLENYY